MEHGLIIQPVATEAITFQIRQGVIRISYIERWKTFHWTLRDISLSNHLYLDLVYIINFWVFVCDMSELDLTPV